MVLLLGDIIEDYSLETASQIALRNCFKEVREEPGYIAVFAGGEKSSQISKKLLLITKTDISSMGRRKSLGSLKSFL